jgi:hypothetical protein
MRGLLASVSLTCLFACGGPEPGSAEHVAQLGRQLERTQSSDAAMYLLLDLEALAQVHPERLAAVREIVEAQVTDQRPVVRAVAVRVRASLDPDDAEARDRLQRFLLDPREPLGLRDGTLAHAITATLPSREEALALLRLQAAQTGRRIGHE